MKERIKKIRTKYQLNQEDFGRKIGIGKTSVSKLESGENNPSEQTILLMCKEFGVNEIWLRTGEGGDDNMFTKVSEEDQFSISLGKLSKSDNKFIHNALNTLAEIEPEKLKAIEEFMRKCLGI